jgi:subtilisin family serine protease
MENKHRLTISMTILILLIVVLVSNCLPGPPTEPSTQPPPPELDTEVDSFSCEEGQAVENADGSNGVFIEGQLILTGPDEAVKAVASQEELILIELCPLSYEPDDADSVVGLYMNPAGRKSEELLRSINENPDYKASGVTAVLNYLIYSSGASGSCVDPFSGGGSPNGTLNSNAPGNQLLSQWALNRIGLSYQPPTATWNKVHIAVFDTAPKPIVPTKKGIVHQDFVTIPWPNSANNDSKFFLKVYDIIGNTTINGPQPEIMGFSEHGLFVAGLIRAIAPESQIHLIRVLGDNGCGDIVKLVNGINRFMAFMKKNRISKVVINLSLGASKLVGDLPFLKNTLNRAYKNGAVIIAATGNDSNLTTVANAQLPASYNFVIGVAATNKSGRRSCYSNKGNANNKDTAAPGGDGGSDTAGNDCVSRNNSWNVTPTPCTSSMGQCGYGLISVITKPAGGFGYGYWSGTSFSTPLVSGLAALAYKQSLDQDEVYCRIQNGVGTPPGDPNLGWGIINIPNSLSATTCGVIP